MKNTETDSGKIKNTEAEGTTGIKTEAGNVALSLAVLAAAIGMLVYGALTGEPGVVFLKASKICMECIGLG